PVAAGKVAVAAFGFDANFCAKFAMVAQLLAGRDIEITHLGIGMGKDDPAFAWVACAGIIPALDKIGARILACLGAMNHAFLIISINCLARPSGGKRAGGTALPVIALAADFCNLDRAV